jgi:hypothetical protein
VDKSPERPPADAAELASWLRELHEKSGLSNRKLASELETDEKNVYRWLGIGSHKPSAPGGIWLLKILRALGVQWSDPPPGTLVGEAAQERLLDVVERQMAVVENSAAELERTTSLLEQIASHLGVGEEPQPVGKKPRRRRASR